MTRGERLKKVRLALGFTQGKAAELSGILQKEISLLENDKRENIPNMYIEWLGQLDVDLNWIFLEKAGMFITSQAESLVQGSPDIKSFFLELTVEEVKSFYGRLSKFLQANRKKG